MSATRRFARRAHRWGRRVHELHERNRSAAWREYVAETRPEQDPDLAEWTEGELRRAWGDR